MEERFLSQELIARLRKMARTGTSVRELIQEVRNYSRTDDGLSLVVDRYLKRAFLLSLGNVRHVEGSSCLGGSLYNDNQIDELLLPLIAASRHQWESDTHV